MGKYHNVLYVALKVAWDWGVTDSPTICQLLSEYRPNCFSHPANYDLCSFPVLAPQPRSIPARGPSSGCSWAPSLARLHPTLSPAGGRTSGTRCGVVVASLPVAAN